MRGERKEGKDNNNNLLREMEMMMKMRKTTAYLSSSIGVMMSVHFGGDFPQLRMTSFSLSSLYIFSLFWFFSGERVEVRQCECVEKIKKITSCV